MPPFASLRFHLWGTVLLVLGAVASASPTQESEVSGLAFIELESDRDSYFVQEPFAVRVRFGFERDFAEDRLVELFRRSLDVPVQVQADWFEDVPGLMALGELGPLERAGSSVGRPQSFALGDDIGLATVGEEERAAQTFVVLTLEGHFVAERDGELLFDGPWLRFAYATGFDEDFFGGRSARDVREERVNAEPLPLRARAWPEEGRPFGFTGAIGTFELQVEAAPRELAIGENLQVVLTVGGTGNFGRFEPPSFEPKGFVSRGHRIERDDGELVVVYELAPSEVVTELPAIELVGLDPRTGRYGRVRSAAVPLNVRAPRPSEAIRSAPAVPMGTAPQSSAENPAELSRWLWGGGLASLVLFVALGVRKRARTNGPPAAEAARVAAARAALELHLSETLQEDPAELGPPFAEYLAAQLRGTAQEVMAGKLGPRLIEAGVSKDLAERCATSLDALIAARYGGAVPSAARSDVRELLSQLDSVRWTSASVG